jgi:AcrR family transcriptional regulator
MGSSATRRSAGADRKVERKVIGSTRVVPKDSEARERIITTAYGLFCRHGIGAVGVDTIIEQSGVAKMTLYRHFRSKDDLVLTVIERREELWTEGWLATEVRRRATDPAERLLAIFDVFDGWFRRRSFEGCLFVNALLEIEDRKHPIHEASRVQLAHIRSFIEELAREAGVAEPEPFARQWHILMKGSIVAAAEGDVDAALRAQALGRLLLADELDRQAAAALAVT